MSSEMLELKEPWSTSSKGKVATDTQIDFTR